MFRENRTRRSQSTPMVMLNMHCLLNQFSFVPPSRNSTHSPATKNQHNNIRADFIILSISTTFEVVVSGSGDGDGDGVERITNKQCKYHNNYVTDTPLENLI